MRQLSTFIKGYRSDMLTVAQHSCATLSTVIHDDTPRDTGNAQSGWGAGVNGRGDYGGSFIRPAQKLKSGDTYWFTSDPERVPYMRRLEYGWSKRQAPSGMVRINVARWDDIVAHSARQVR